jgi:RecB family exonuclease
VRGTAVHAPLEADNRARLAGQPPLTQEALLALARQTLEAEGGDLLAPRLPDMTERVLALLSVYARQVQSLFQPLSVESWFRFPLPDHPGWSFKGRIDALMQDSTGQRVIVDYKTTSRAWEQRKEHRDRQAGAYVWAMQQTGEEIRVVVCIPLIASRRALGLWGSHGAAQNTTRARGHQRLSIAHR